MTQITDGKRVMTLEMKQYAGDGATWTPDWSNDFVGNSGEAKWNRDIEMWVVENLEGWEEAAEEANEEGVQDGYEAVTIAEYYDIASDESSIPLLLWAFDKADTYDLEAGENSICLAMVRRAEMMKEYEAAEAGEETETVIHAAYGILKTIYE